MEIDHYALPFFMHKTFHSYGVPRAFETASYKHRTPPEFLPRSASSY